MTSTVYLSERNLRTLLSKLERKAAGSETECTLIKHQNDAEKFRQTMQSIFVVAVADDEYYGALNRAPGEVHPLDEPT